jgi:mono/diheme cytochrome c family protein
LGRLRRAIHHRRNRPRTNRRPSRPTLSRFTLWIDEADALPLKIQTQYPSESVTVSFADFVFGDSARPVGEPYAAPAGAEPVEIARDRPRDASLVASLARLLANPHPAETNSLNQGRLLYLRQCMECHGVDGRAMDNFELKAGDLTKPDTWKHGATPGETYVSIYKGASASMPPFKDLIDENRIWHLVNYVQSLKRDR